MKKILSIISLCLLSISQAQDSINNTDIFLNEKYKQKLPKIGKSTNDGLHYTLLSKESASVSIGKYAYQDGLLKEIIFESDTLAVDDYELSADENQILLATKLESIYRHSKKGFYYVYNIAEKTLKPLSNFGLGKINLAKFSPSGTHIAFMRNNNMFISDAKQETAITTDGKWNEIINGGLDWVYEEEFSLKQGFFWSDNSKYIAYYKINESAVNVFHVEMFGTWYNKYYSFKYPKAGEKNAEVSLAIYDVQTAQNKVVQMPSNVAGITESYIPNMFWDKKNQLVFLHLNRLQNTLSFLRANPQEDKLDAKVFFQEKSNTYVGVENASYLFLADNSLVFTSENLGYNNIFKLDEKGKNVKPILQGNFDVSEIVSLDEEKQILYFTSHESGASHTLLYKLNLKTGKHEKITPELGEHKVMFSAKNQFFIDTYSNINEPISVSLKDAAGNLVRTLHSNQNLQDSLSKLNLSKFEFFTIKTEDKVNLNAWILKPANFDAQKKYPVLFYVYGGPGVNTVLNHWQKENGLWFQLLAQKGYIVVSVDGRGTGHRGEAFKKVTYKKLGYYETIDQIQAAKYMASLAYVDKTRIGVFGWSFGGYMSSLCILQGADVFKTAVAVAPITHWKHYDSIYTERYMQTPELNAKGYAENNPVDLAQKLQGKYLLIHGSADDNVHIHNTMDLTTALIEANKPFEHFIYPNKNHSIKGKPTSDHLYEKMTQFILNNL